MPIVFIKSLLLTLLSLSCFGGEDRAGSDTEKQSAERTVTVIRKIIRREVPIKTRRTVIRRVFTNPVEGTNILSHDNNTSSKRNQSISSSDSEESDIEATEPKKRAIYRTIRRRPVEQTNRRTVIRKTIITAAKDTKDPVNGRKASSSRKNSTENISQAALQKRRNALTESSIDYQPSWPIDTDCLSALFNYLRLKKVDTH